MRRKQRHINGRSSEWMGNAAISRTVSRPSATIRLCWVSLLMPTIRFSVTMSTVGDRVWRRYVHALRGRSRTSSCCGIAVNAQRTNRIYSFYDEPKSRYSSWLWKYLIDMVSGLPSTAVIDREISCMRWVLVPELNKLDQIRRIVHL